MFFKIHSAASFSSQTNEKKKNSFQCVHHSFYFAKILIAAIQTRSERFRVRRRRLQILWPYKLQGSVHLRRHEAEQGQQQQIRGKRRLTLECIKHTAKIAKQTIWFEQVACFTIFCVMPYCFFFLYTKAVVVKIVIYFVCDLLLRAETIFSLLYILYTIVVHKYIKKTYLHVVKPFSTNNNVFTVFLYLHFKKWLFIRFISAKEECIVSETRRPLETWYIWCGAAINNKFFSCLFGFKKKRLLEFLIAAFLIN